MGKSSVKNSEDISRAKNLLKMNFFGLFALILFQLPLTSAFVIPSPSQFSTRSLTRRILPAANTSLFAAEKTKKKGALDESVRTKLVTESIAPWRTLRLFLYGALGSGAFIGGLVTLPGTAAILSGAKEGNINVEVSLRKIRCVFSGFGEVRVDKSRLTPELSTDLSS